ncbi:MAG TPA: phosphatidate cytidylyltransferase [Phycisphaerae bacterium]|nr:phosphatidate cytidylyltransferase [Phycisphaerae bacterium]
MLKRILFGAVMIAAVVGLLILDWWLEHQGLRPRLWGHTAVLGIPVTAAVVLLLLKAFTELERLAAAAGGALLGVSGLTGVLALGSLPFWLQFAGIWLGASAAMVVLAIIVMLVFAEQMLRRPAQEAIRNVGCTFLAVLYLGVGGGMILQIRLSFGVPALAFFLVAVKFTDMGAFFTGTAIGRHKLIPAISPGKSWEGLVGGLIAGAAAAGVAGWLLAGVRGGYYLGTMPLWQAAVFGAVIGLAGQFADLCESLLKRSAGVKDSAAAVPGFGGVLDIIDSPLLASPVAYLLLAACCG